MEKRGVHDTSAGVQETSSVALSPLFRVRVVGFTMMLDTFFGSGCSLSQLNKSTTQHKSIGRIRNVKLFIRFGCLFSHWIRSRARVFTAVAVSVGSYLHLSFRALR